MKIKSVERIEYYFIETDEGISYRRSVEGNEDCWERLYGDSWEPAYSEGLEMNNLINDYFKHIFE